jgi:hypothetical protein
LRDAGFDAMPRYTPDGLRVHPTDIARMNLVKRDSGNSSICQGSGISASYRYQLK